MTHGNVNRARNSGWYQDPLGGGGQRYWDGQRWLDDAAVQAAAGSPAANGTSSENDTLVVVGWITAILFPIIGLIVGIVVSGRNDKRGMHIVIAAVVAFIVWIAIIVAINSGHSGSSEYDYGVISVSSSSLR